MRWFTLNNFYRDYLQGIPGEMFRAWKFVNGASFDTPTSVTPLTVNAMISLFQDAIDLRPPEGFGKVVR
jgi:hypothetical protein